MHALRHAQGAPVEGRRRVDPGTGDQGGTAIGEFEGSPLRAPTA